MNEYSLNEFLEHETVKRLNKFVTESGGSLEGNCLYRHHEDFVPHADVKEPLRRNLYALCQHASSVIEVGFNAGHSCALYLYANPEIEVVAFDLCEHAYTQPCAEYLAATFNFSIIKGDSSDTLPRYQPARTVDLIHVDGGHSKEQAFRDISNCQKFSDNETVLVVDDAYLGGIEDAIEYHLNHGLIIEIDYETTHLEQNKFHRIFNYC